MFRWEQGQHVAIIGSNGTGKTYLESKILPLRDYVVVCRTKADDITFDGFRTIKTVDGITVGQHKYLLAPRYEAQRYEIHRAVEMAWRQRAWCVAFDELFYLCEKLRLANDADRLLTQGRSLKISVVVGMQRPSRITRFGISESIHVFVFRAEGRDVKTIEEATTPRIVPAIAALRRYEFAYFNRLTGAVTIGDANHLEAL